MGMLCAQRAAETVMHTPTKPTPGSQTQRRKANRATHDPCPTGAGKGTSPRDAAKADRQARKAAAKQARQVAERDRRRARRPKRRAA